MRESAGPRLTYIATRGYTMSPPVAQRSSAAVRCDDCRSVVESGGRQELSFLLLEQLTIPVLGCDDHLEQFASVCELTAKESAELLDQRPAGGLRCPGCRLASYDSPYPLIQVRNGAVIPMACSDHQSEILERFQTGLRTRNQLTTRLDTSPDPSL